MMKTYKEYKEKLEQKQKSMTKEEVIKMLKEKNESVLDLDALPGQNHNWVDRGAKVTCEGGGHAYHEVWRRR